MDPFRFLLPSPLQLAEQAASLRFACLLWSCDSDLVITALAGQLAPKVWDRVGVGTALRAIRAADDPALVAHERALAGEIMPYRVERNGETWAVTVAPIDAGWHRIGVKGCAQIAEASAVCPAIPDIPESWAHFLCVADEEPAWQEDAACLVRAGEYVSVSRRQGIYAQRAVSLERFDRMLALDKLTPQSAASPLGAAGRPQAASGGRGMRRRSPGLRLVDGSA